MLKLSVKWIFFLTIYIFSFHGSAESKSESENMDFLPIAPQSYDGFNGKLQVSFEDPNADNFTVTKLLKKDAIANSKNQKSLNLKGSPNISTSSIVKKRAIQPQKKEGRKQTRPKRSTQTKQKKITNSKKRDKQ